MLSRFLNYVLKNHAAHVSSKKGKEKWLQIHIGQIPEQPSLSRITNQHRMDEEHCARYDAIAAEDHSEVATAAMRFRRENTWVLVLNSSGPNSPMNQREDYHEAIKIKGRLFEESGKDNTKFHPSEQVRPRPGQPFTWHDEGTERVDPKTGWEMIPFCSLIKLIFDVLEII